MLDVLQSESVIGAVTSFPGWCEPGTIVDAISVIAAIVIGGLLFRAYRRTNSLSQEQNRLAERQLELLDAQSKTSEAFRNWTRTLKEPTPVYITGKVQRSYPNMDRLTVWLQISNPGDAPIFLIQGGLRLILKGRESIRPAVSLMVLTMPGGRRCPGHEIPGGTGRTVQMTIDDADRDTEDIKRASVWVDFVAGDKEKSLSFGPYFVLWRGDQREMGDFSDHPAGIEVGRKWVDAE